MHLHRLLGAALAALFFLATGHAEAASSPLTQKRGTITTQNLVPAGACTVGGCVETEVLTAGSMTVQVTGTYTASGGLSAQATTDGTTWVTLCSSTCSTTFTRSTTGATSATIASGVQDIFQIPATGYKRVRITALGAVTGTATITIQPTELVPSGFASISGGAGDASASNQTSGSQKTQVVDGLGNVIGATSNALDVNIKSGSSSGAVAQGSTTSGQSGSLVQGAVTTSAPTYTTAQTSPFSLRTTGALRIGGDSGAFASGAFASGALASGSVASGAFASGSIASGAIVDGADVALGATSDAAATAGGTGTVSAKLRRISTQLPAAVGATTMSAAMPVTIATDDARIGIVTETAPASDTASSGLNGRLQRIAQNLTTLNTSVNADPNYTQAPGSAAPSRALALGARGGANLVAVSQPTATVAVSVSTATTTQLVALSSGQVIHVGSFSLISAGTGNARFVYGTGTNCGTGTTNLTGDYPLIANAGISLGSGLGPVLVVPAGNALCLTTSAAVDIGGHVTHTQFAP